MKVDGDIKCVVKSLWGKDLWGGVCGEIFCGEECVGKGFL